MFAVTDEPSLGNHAVRLKRLVVQSTLQENDVSWNLVDSGSAVTACPPTIAKEVRIIRGPARVLTGADESQPSTRQSNNSNAQVPVASVRRLTMHL